MTFTPIARGTQNWDVPLNAALAQLDANITSGSSAAFQATNNLSDLTNVPQARSNLGISQGAVQGVNQYNVKDYGALGNNVADDTVAIQNAINAAQTAGGRVYFPAGKYRLNSSVPLNVTGAAVVFAGSGVENTQIVIGPSFSGSSAVTVSGSHFMFQDMSLEGSNSTTTSNPACHGITGTGAQTFRVFNASFLNINGYAVRAMGTAGTTLHGGYVSHVKIQSCAGAVHVLSDTTNTAANFMLNNVFTRFTGVNSGANANLDCIRIENSWDVLVQNCFAWMNATVGGTGVALRVRGDCAATFIQNLDALGPQTGTANVVIEGNGTTSPQNVQIQGGVIQQGLIGILIADATNQVRVRNVRIINNQTHGVSVTSTGFGIYVDECLFSLNGAGASGSNYDINWSGTATGYVTDNRFATAITSIGVAGVQATVNITAGQNVRFLNCDFAGTSSASTNWFTNLPQVATRQDGSNMEYIGSLDFRLGTGRIQYAPSLSTGTALSTNVAGTDAFDRFRILGSGSQQFGTGAAARDTTWGRQGVAQVGTSDSDIAITLAGKSLKVASGSNAKAGTVTANGTTAVTVTTTAITANSVVVFGLKTQAGTAATTAPFMSAVTAGTSFQIKSSAGDTSVYNWVILDLI